MASKTKKWLDPKKIAEHGQYIFIYANRRNHVLYSLTRALNNHASRKQLPFFGRNSIPPSIRKDEWRPLATVCFPSGYQGLVAYKQLREFRKRHELEWTMEDAKNAWDLYVKQSEMDLEPETKFRNANQRRRYWAQWYNTTQKANCIADLAAVLDHQTQAAEVDAEKDAIENSKNQAAISKAEARIEEIRQKLKGKVKNESSEESWQEYRALKNEKIKLSKALQKPVPHAALNGEYTLRNDARIPARKGFFKARGTQPPPSISMEGVKIEWADVLDAQYASTWPPGVQHDEMPARSHKSRNTLTTAVQPPLANQDLQAQRQQSIVEKGLGTPTSPTPKSAASQPTTQPKYDPNIPEPHLRHSPRRIDRILHRLKHGAY